MTAISAPPLTLADVKKGDLVWLFGAGPIKEWPVQKVTKHTLQVNDMTFQKHTGYKKSNDIWRRSYEYILIGEPARLRRQEIIRKNKLHAAALPLRLRGEELTREIVAAYRAACDEADRVLDEVEGKTP